MGLITPLRLLSCLGFVTASVRIGSTDRCCERCWAASDGVLLVDAIVKVLSDSAVEQENASIYALESLLFGRIQ